MVPIGIWTAVRFDRQNLVFMVSRFVIQLMFDYVLLINKIVLRFSLHERLYRLYFRKTNGDQILVIVTADQAVLRAPRDWILVMVGW